MPLIAPFLFQKEDKCHDFEGGDVDDLGALDFSHQEIFQVAHTVGNDGDGVGALAVGSCIDAVKMN